MEYPAFGRPYTGFGRCLGQNEIRRDGRRESSGPLFDSGSRVQEWTELGRRARLTILTRTSDVMREIFEKMRDAFESCVARYTVGFVFPFRSTPHLDVAAGVAVKRNGRRLIVTARHVLTDEDFDGVHLLLPLEQPFDRGGSIMVPKEPHPMVAMPVPRNVIRSVRVGGFGLF